MDTSPQTNRLAWPAFFKQAWSEPYRLLFPAGLAFGILGVSLWPLFYSGWLNLPYPVPHHANLMIQCFFGSFVFGFLGTAMPRMLDTRGLTWREVATILVLLAGTAGSHVLGKSLWGHGCFFLLLVMFPAFMARRFRERRDTPPPGFVLVLLGWASALFGTAVLLVLQITPLPAFPVRFGQLLLYQGFLLFPILGIGAFLFPRFFGLPNRQNFDETLTLPPGWFSRAAIALVCGLVVLAGFALEAAGFIQYGPLLRLLAMAVYLSQEVPFYRTFRKHGTLGLSLALALGLLLAGKACLAIFPHYFKAMEHIVFMGGFGLLTFTVAARVILGHGGQSHRFKARFPSLLIVLVLVVASLLTRISGDVFPKVMISHQVYAALIWITGALVWGWALLPGVFRRDDEPS